MGAVRSAVGLILTSLEVSVIFLVLQGAGRRGSSYIRPRFRKWCWLILGLRLLLPFRQRLPGAAAGWNAGLEWLQEGEAALLTARAAEVLLAVWAVGALWRLASGYFQYRRFQTQVLDTALEITDQAVLRQFDAVREELLLPRQVKLYQSGQIRTPMAAGVLHPRLLLPDRAYSREELQLILSHEGMHIDHRDVLYKLTMAAAEAVHWFNPLSRQLKKQAFGDLEIVCDSYVTEEMDRESRGVYARTILDGVGQETERETACSTCYYGGKEFVRNRLEQILEKGNQKKGLPVLAAAALMLLLLECLLPAWPAAGDRRQEGAVQVEFLNGTGTVTREGE